MDLPLYEYEPLNGPEEIRVLELSATKTRIETRILHVSVSTRNFQALSYVWGNPDQENQAIVLDALGTAIGWIPLTKNLGHAMCDLRDADELERKVFWIDQICINQQDEKEKNHQVAMISQIFTQARRVITYLGPAAAEEEEERGIQLLKRISGNISDATWHLLHEARSIRRAWRLLLDESIQLEQPPSDLDLVADEPDDENEVSKRYVEQGWEWLVHVAYGEWTQRLWIVQEQLLNKEITTLRGHRLIDWDSIAAIPILFAIGYLPWQYRDAGLRALGERSLPWSQVENFLYGMWWERHARLKPGTSHTWSPLFENLLWYQPLLCSDPRHRVYAILAISEDAEDLGLKPDYSTLNTAEALSKQLSIRVLENFDSLKLLSRAFPWLQPLSKLPSWCFTLDRPTNINTPDTIAYDVYSPHPEQYGHNLARFSMDKSILVVKGRILDYVSSPSPKIAWPPDASRSTLRMGLLSSFIHVLPDGFSIEDVISLLRTITARAPWLPSASAGVSVNEVMVFHLSAYLRDWSRWLADWDETPPPKDMHERCDDIATKVQAFTPGIAYPEHSDDGMTREEYAAAQKVLQYALEKGRCLGRTHVGRLYNAVYTVQEDDVVVALRGADRLYTIRLVGNTYKIIGDVFVDGLMHGEAYENQGADDVDYDIELA